MFGQRPSSKSVIPPVAALYSPAALQASAAPKSKYQSVLSILYPCILHFKN